MCFSMDVGDGVFKYCYKVCTVARCADVQDVSVFLLSCVHVLWRASKIPLEDIIWVNTIGICVWILHHGLIDLLMAFYTLGGFQF